MKITLDRNTKTPTKAHETDAGFDLYTPEAVTLKAHSHIIIDTGVHIAIPEGYAGLIVSKSGLNVTHNITSTGLIDSGYTGSIRVKLYNNGEEDYYFKANDKITQLVLLPIHNESLELVDSLDDTERGSNGFGSSGR